MKIVKPEVNIISRAMSANALPHNDFLFPLLILAGCGKKDFRRLLPLSYLSRRERRLRNEAIFNAGCGTNKCSLTRETSFFRTLLGEGEGEVTRPDSRPTFRPQPPTPRGRTARNSRFRVTDGAALPPPEAGPFVYIFNHIPRTGGVSIGAFIESIFPVVRDYPKGPTDADLAAWRDTPIDLDGLPDGTVVAGHYNAPGARLRERYPAAMASPRYRLITFLRDPQTWLRSCLEYFCAQGAALDTAATEFANAFAHAFEVPTLSPEAALDRYWMIGTTEHAQTCCDRLAAAMGMPPRPLARLNAAQSRHDIATLSRAIRRYLAASPHDLLLYAEACRRVERILAAGLAVS